MKPQLIISGAQTGADRGGLDAAIALGIPYGGWVPKGRRAEDGRIPDRYTGLRETESSEYPARTLLNVQEACGTVLFTRGPAERGSLLTLRFADQCSRPFLCLDVDKAEPILAADDVWRWLRRMRIQTLNVAGNRESVSPGIQAWVRDCLVCALGSRP